MNNATRCNCYGNEQVKLQPNNQLWRTFHILCRRQAATTLGWGSEQCSFHQIVKTRKNVGEKSVTAQVVSRKVLGLINVSLKGEPEHTRFFPPEPGADFYSLFWNFDSEFLWMPIQIQLSYMPRQEFQPIQGLIQDSHWGGVCRRNRRRKKHWCLHSEGKNALTKSENRRPVQWKLGAYILPKARLVLRILHTYIACYTSTSLISGFR